MSDNSRDAFATALISHLVGLRRYAMALVGNSSAADDLVQDCIERALAQFGTLRDLRRMGGWLRSILHNLYVDELRKKRSQGVGTDLMEVENDLALSVPPEDRAATVDIIRAFNQLSVEHRRILLLVGIEGMSYQQIAAELAIPIGTVMSRLARARERLRAALDRETVLTPDELPKLRRSVE